MTSDRIGRTRAFDRASAGHGMARTILWLVFYLAVVAAAAAVGSLASRDGQAWYDGVNKPWFTPPDWVFSPVWSVLYVSIAVAAWLVHRRGGSLAVPMTVWAVQLALNVAWTWLFFGLERPGAAMVEIVVLLVSILATIWLFYGRTRWAGLLLVPYLGWVTYAAALNFQIWRLN